MKTILSQIKTEIIKDPQLGEIFVRINPRAKNISIRIKRSGEVQVTCPAARSRNRALVFLNEKREWIAKRREEFLSRSRLEFRLPIQTRLFEILQKGDSPRSNKTARYIPTEGHSHEDVQCAIKQMLEKIWRIEAKELLPQRMELIAQRCGLKFRNLSFRKSRTRWGSCSGCNDISLNINVMQLPDELVDFIMIHELCHTVHKNHSADFHSLVNRLTGGRESELNKKLKKYTPIL